MLFSSLSLVTLLSLSTTVFSAPTAGFERQIVKRETVTPATTTAAFTTLTSQVNSAKEELSSGLAEIDTSDADAVYAVAAPILKATDRVICVVLQEVDANIEAIGASFSLRKRDIFTRQSNGTDLEEAAQAIADAIVAIVNLLEPLQELIEANPVLGALLSPLFSNLSVERVPISSMHRLRCFANVQPDPFSSLIYVTSALFLVLTGVLDLVANLLSGLGSALGGVGLGGLGDLLGL
ncbi:hypothetical protein JCM11641_003637 [Rhodosporidiobolus odoratus]